MITLTDFLLSGNRPVAAAKWSAARRVASLVVVPFAVYPLPSSQDP